MRFRSALPVPLLVVVVSCGYVGPVVPPSTRIPLAVADLSVVQRGDQLLVAFTTPPRTTDNLTLRQFEAINLRIEAPGVAARDYDLPLPPPLTKEEEARITPVHDSIPAADWADKHVQVRVRTAARKDGVYSGWSNTVSMDVTSPLARPSITVQATAAGYVVKWTPAAAGVSHRILRASPGMKAPVELATVQTDTFTDAAAQWNTPYSYTVVAVKGQAESLASEPANVNAPDTFPPSAPGDVTAVPSPQGVELSWRRSPETDVRGYFVYRSEAGGPFVKQDAVPTLPNFSDTTAQHGKSYSYQVSAVDTSGNESPRSASASIDVP